MSAAGEFHALTVRTARHEQGDALVVTFDVPERLASVFRFKPGQHVALRAMIDGAEVRRTYSICAGLDEAMRIGIKRVADGRFSRWAHATLASGSLVDVMPPQGRFTLPAGEIGARRIVMFAAGSGITPVLGMTRQALSTEPGTRVTLIYANRHRDAVMFGEEIEALKDRHLGRLDVIGVLTGEGEADVDLLQGRIDAGKVRALGERLVDYRGAERIYVCGPGSMIKTVRDTLMDLGIARERIHHEFFQAATGGVRGERPTPRPVAAEAAGGTELTVILDGARHRIVAVPGQSVLAAALAAGIKPPYSCQGGMCCTCRARIVSGAAEMTTNYSLEPWEMDRGFTLTCQAVPTTAQLVVDYDAM